MNRTKLLQVTRAVEREIKGGSGSGFRGSKGGTGPFGTGSSRNGSDWVMVKGKESGHSG
ncbi:hypothetical protein A2U01_0065568, partial [Trifolium medium]|nr:hypothetical protein [Trifolium medium]